MRTREIERHEIYKIITSDKCLPREKAFFAVMAQSGLKPNTIKKLRVKDVERILEPDTPIPCKISKGNGIFGKAPAFLAKDAVKYLKLYLPATAIPDNLLFCSHTNPDEEVNTANISRTFSRLVGTKSGLQLRSLAEFYQKNAVHYLIELKKKPALKDESVYRELYERKAMPFLEIESSTLQIQQLSNEMKELRERLGEIENTVSPKPPKTRRVTDIDAELKRIEKWIKNHPEEAEAEERWYDQMADEQAELERLMKKYPDQFVAYTHGLKRKVEAVRRVLQARRQSTLNTQKDITKNSSKSRRLT